MALDTDTASSGEDLAQYMMSQVGGTGDMATFEYSRESAALTDLTFGTGGIDVHAYMVTIDTQWHDYVILAFCYVDSWNAMQNQMLSAIDSFSLDDQRLAPGPVSQLFYAVPQQISEQALQIPFFRSRVTSFNDPAFLDATSITIEREAAVLAPYGSQPRSVYAQAWQRYYRMIYRDNYMRLQQLADSITTAYASQRMTGSFPETLLQWLQGFDYDRAGGLSDFEPPISCLASHSGDCDSLGIIYAILLNSYDIDTILMVSDVYSHAMAAVDFDGSGARFPFGGRNWLVAEFTADVAIGQIASTMADPAGWIGVSFDFDSDDAFPALFGGW